MRYWLFKSEPGCFSIDDLARVGTEPWDGTRNYQVRNFMRDDMRVGDKALFYHSNAGQETGCVGTMTVASAAKTDPTQFDLQSEHPDPKSDPHNPRWLLVDVQFEAVFPRVVTLAEIKADPAFSTMPLVQKGNRLSVFPISKEHYQNIVALANE